MSEIFINHAESCAMEVRQALLAIGKSPDTHINELRFDFVNEKAHRKEVRFLRHVITFYQNLDLKRQMIFLYDFLERGRNYPHWHLDKGFRKGEYERLKAELSVLLSQKVL